MYHIIGLSILYLYVSKTTDTQVIRSYDKTLDFYKTNKHLYDLKNNVCIDLPSQSENSVLLQYKSIVYDVSKVKNNKTAISITKYISNNIDNDMQKIEFDTHLDLSNTTLYGFIIRGYLRIIIWKHKKNVCNIHIYDISEDSNIDNIVVEHYILTFIMEKDIEINKITSLNSDIVFYDTNNERLMYYNDFKDGSLQEIKFKSETIDNSMDKTIDETYNNAFKKGNFELVDNQYVIVDNGDKFLDVSLKNTDEFNIGFFDIRKVKYLIRSPHSSIMDVKLYPRHYNVSEMVFPSFPEIKHIICTLNVELITYNLSVFNAEKHECKNTFYPYIVYRANNKYLHIHQQSFHVIDDPLFNETFEQLIVRAFNGTYIQEPTNSKKLLNFIKNDFAQFLSTNLLIVFSVLSVLVLIGILTVIYITEKGKNKYVIVNKNKNKNKNNKPLLKI